MNEEYPEMDDRAFVDYMTSKFYLMKDSGLGLHDNKSDKKGSNFTMDSFNFNGMYPGYDQSKSIISFIAR